MPGTVYAANYDTGGQGVAYNVTSTNGSANSYRSDGVDLETTADPSDTTAAGNGYDLGWTATGQWFNYTVNVATAGTYTVAIRLSSPYGITDALHIANSSGTNLSGSVAVPNTGGYQTWTTVNATVTLPAGQQTLTVDQDDNGWNFHYMTFTLTSGGGGTGGDQPFGGTPAAVPGTAYAANYDTGGQGVAYNVTSTNGSANSYRSDGVDLEATTDPSPTTAAGNGYDLGWTATGQWFNYTVNVATAGTYTVSLRLAAPTAVADGLHIDNSAKTDLSGTIAVPATGGYQDWTTVTESVTLPAASRPSPLTRTMAAGTSTTSPSPRPPEAGRQPPAAPTGLTVTGTTSSSVSLSWTAPSGTVTGYYVYQGGSQVASVTGTTDTVTGLAASTAYTFTVAAYNSGGTSPQSGQVSATTASSGSGPPTGGSLGSNVHRLHAERGAELDPESAEHDRQRSGRQPVRHGTLRPAVRAGHVRLHRGPADLPGRLLHQRRGPGPEPEPDRHQRLDRRLQPVLRHHLQRDRQLLALGIQPHYQRHWPDRVRGRRRLLGGLPGRSAAARSGQRQPVADGLLQRLARLRQRRVHRRLGLHRRDRHQRFAAAVFRPEQRPGRLEQCRLEPGLLRRPRRPGAKFRQ